MAAGPTADAIRAWSLSRGGPWRTVARPEQLAPPGTWDIWLALAGRGWGKSRTGAEWCIEQAVMHPGTRGALVAPTAADARDVMTEGESGVMACALPGLCHYEPSKRRITFTNGSMLTLYSADEPDRLRGPQHHFAWCDELAAWRRLQKTWDMMQMGMRLGDHPRICITTTPRPLPLIKKLVKDPRTVVVRGTTFDNLHNLAPSFREAVLDRYEGTTLGRQELYADILDDLPGALVARAVVDNNRVAAAPKLTRTVIGLDPAGTGLGDLAGIVAAAEAGGHYYILEDRSERLSARGTAQRAWALYDELDADALVYETNLGKDWLAEVLKNVWAERWEAKHVLDDEGDEAQDIPPAPPAPLRPVTAVKGKALRAQPVAMRYEQGRVHHVGSLPELEDELCAWIPEESPKSPDRLDAMVHAVTELARAERSRVVLADPPHVQRRRSA